MSINWQTRSTRAVLLAALAVSLAGGPALAEGGTEKFYKAFYLEHAGRQWSAARKLYEEAVGDSTLDGALKTEAKSRLAACKEELASQNFTAFMPPDVMAYVELRQPGEQVLRLLDQLGLLSTEHGAPKDEALAKAGRYLSISPSLVRELLGVRGVAVAVTGFNPLKMMPMGVLVFHPGDVGAIRGLLQTGLPAGAQPTEPILGFSTYLVENMVLVTMTERMVVVSLDRPLIEGVVRRLRGEESKSLATNPRLAEALKGRDDSLLYFLVDAKTVMPYVEGAAAMAPEDMRREIAMAKAILDPNSLQTVVGKVGVSEAGLFLDLGLNLDRNHHNLVYNFFRTASINKDTLKCIPDGAAGFVVTALNDATSRHSPNTPGQGDAAPIVTAMDLGREFFANITSIAAFVVPPGEEEGTQGPPIPDAALVISVNDPAKTEAIWRQVLGIAALAGGAPKMDGATESIDGVDARAFTMPEGITVHFAVLDNDALISPSRAALAAAIRAKRSKKSVLSDPAFAAGLSRMSSGAASAVFVHPARCAKVAAGLPGGAEGLREVEPFLPLLSSTVASLVVEYSGERLGLGGSINGIPKVGGLVAQLIREGPSALEAPKSASASPTRSEERAEKADAPSKAEKPRAARKDDSSPRDLRSRFSVLAKNGEYDEAKNAATALMKELADNAQALNNFAWELLTEKPYMGRFSELALRAAERANELTQYKLWAYLDTLALARFENGDVDGAIKAQRKAIELASDKSRGELQERLARFEAAAKSKS